MRRTVDPEEAMAWLADLAPEGSVTGYDAEGWPASTWVLHAMHENRSLDGLGTHDDIHRRRLDAGDVAPLIIGDVNLDEATTVTGTPLGFMVNPGSPWVRVTWADYLARFPDLAGTSEYPPCHRWFPKGSWPVSVSAPPEGSLDQESLAAVLGMLADHSEEGDETRCYAFYASLPAGGDFDSVHLWEGPLRSVEDLISENGGPYDFSPTNLWPVDRSWFVWTDYDLQGTKVSGEPALVDAMKSVRVLECVDWQAETTDRDLA